MFKKILAPLVMFSMVLFTQCTDDQFDQESNYPSLKAGGGNGGGGNGGGGGGGHTEPAGNNLSFPVFASDGFSISMISEANFKFEVPYTGPFTGLTAEELVYLNENDPWYAQKETGNVWQAEFANANQDLYVTFIDWGDVIEAVNPKIGRPFRLEVTLYYDISDAPMTGFLMALLANPSSKNEIQGTNATTYEGNWATIVSNSPKLIVQPLAADAIPVWDDDAGMWIGEGVSAPLTGFGFAPELNVGGKYIYGASQGGWKPTALGLYRLTFYMSGNGNASFIHLEDAVIGNYTGNTAGQWGSPETTASQPVVDTLNNLSYVDVTVVTSGGGGSGGH